MFVWLLAGYCQQVHSDAILAGAGGGGGADTGTDGHAVAPVANAGGCVCWQPLIHACNARAKHVRESEIGCMHVVS